VRELANLNYQKELEKLILQQQKEGKVPRLFLHAMLCTMQQLCPGISFQVFFLLQCFFIIPIFPLRRNMRKEWKKSAG